MSYITALREWIYERDGGICQLCDEPVVGAFTLDHRIPRSRGGPDSVHNLQLAHRRCNSSKGARDRMLDPKPPRSTPEKKWTREKIIHALREYAALYGHSPPASHFNVAMARATGHPEIVARFYEHGWPHYNTVVREFGRWNAALEAAGFAPRGNGERVRLTVCDRFPKT